jgi:hypothetical protein
MTKPLVFMAMPHYCGQVHADAAKSFWCEACVDDSIDTLTVDHGSSLLANCFNSFWALALNWRDERRRPDFANQYAGRPITHFAMLHADIAAAPGWLNTLMAEMEATDADIVSAVVPIKSVDGTTSTAISSDDPFRVTRRLTMHEVMQLPETFDAEACGYPHRTILANTGCWLARFDRTWNEAVHFEIKDKIVLDAAGQYVPKVCPEDWNFSRMVWNLGGKIVATRKVKVRHVGASAFTNDHAWGALEIDHMADGQVLPVFAGKKSSLGTPSVGAGDGLRLSPVLSAEGV